MADQPPRNPREWPAWPDVPGGQGQLPNDAAVEQYKSRLTEAAQRRGAFDSAMHESHVAIETAQIDVLKASIERSRDSAKTIQTASTAIATLYTGLATLVFSVSDKSPLPLRGVLPVLFLGGAIVLSTAYLAWLGPASKVGPFPKTVDAVSVRVERVKWFNNWISLSVLRKAWVLRLSVLYLAAGLIFLPTAFLPINASTASAAEPPATSGVPPEWPPVPTADTGISRIRYKAEVEEVAKARADAAKASAGIVTSGYRVPEKCIWFAALAVWISASGLVLYQAKLGHLRKAIKALTFSE
jgi:hypothetical protein